MIDTNIKQTVCKKLAIIEKEYNVNIILAIESGSRAWGFESTDSDYDVRFIYRHELKWYLNVLPRRDVIELPIEGIEDYSGWDIRKALFLMNKSNPVLFEWLKSPIVYKVDEGRFNMILDIHKSYFSPISSIYHYMHMAKRNASDFLIGNKIKVKKYFYVLRPILASIWIEKYNESPPMEFETLLNLISDKNLLDDIQLLLQRKKAGIELGMENKIHSINHFIQEMVMHFDKATRSFNPREKPKADTLNDLLWKLVF
ncbi:MAG: nucleotidyltransferase domain-containing protein [Candidatus Brocadiae bacterium]|nr:nucleotidyltransferase domain-containing protein [Candidatus Brocadiia bacterium]